MNLLDDDALARASWVDLIQARARTKDPALQARLAPFEHRAYAREHTSTPWDALQMALLIPGYQAFKAVAGGSRTTPSLSQVGQGLLGAWEGLTR